MSSLSRNALYIALSALYMVCYIFAMYKIHRTMPCSILYIVNMEQRIVRDAHCAWRAMQFMFQVSRNATLNLTWMQFVAFIQFDHHNSVQDRAYLWEDTWPPAGQQHATQFMFPLVKKSAEINNITSHWNLRLSSELDTPGNPSQHIYHKWKHNLLWCVLKTPYTIL